MMNTKILPCVIGLGYVGMPVFNILKKKFKTVGFDKDQSRIKQLRSKYDRNNEFSKKELILKNKSYFSYSKSDLKNCNFFIICVPTPVLRNKKPDLKSLKEVSNLLSNYIKIGDIIFFESTVYPGATNYLTENILEKKSKLKNNKDFWVGYSPERINPGDKNKTIKKINKIVGINLINKNVKYKVQKVYKNLTQNIFFTNSIKDAEMSKVIENVQRDINIAFMNEIFQISEKLNLNFKNIIRLASSKWNFLKFSPGLVGGHCLPVDPYYLYEIAKKNKLNAKFLLAGRNVNNSMENFIIKKILGKIEYLKKKNGKKIIRVLLSGITYKAEVADLRNSLPFSIYNKLKQKKNVILQAYDPCVNIENSKKYKILKTINLKKNKFDLIILLVNHMSIIKKLKKTRKKNKLNILDIFNYLKNVKN